MDISVIVPLYNEAESLPELHAWIKRVMDEHGGCKPAFATTNYHVFRGYVLAQKVGMQDAQGISAKTKWYFYPNAFLRELVGLIVDKKWKHIIFLTLLSAAEFGLSYLSFIG